MLLLRCCKSPASRLGVRSLSRFSIRPSLDLKSGIWLRASYRQSWTVYSRRLLTTQLPEDEKSRRVSNLRLHARENIYTIPNLLTFSRLAAAPVIGYLVVNGQPFWALSLVIYSGVTDLLDGYIARKYNMQSVVGSVIDPMADKALMVTLASCLAVSGDIPIYMAVLILGRDGMLALMAVYYRYISLPPPKTFWRFWDFSLPSAEVHPTKISKYNTFLQMVYLGSSLVYPVIQSALTAATAEYLSIGLTGLGYVVGTTTVWSGFSYIFSSSAVKILTKRPKM
jgi:cardiolipin synthase